MANPSLLPQPETPQPRHRIGEMVVDFILDAEGGAMAAPEDILAQTRSELLPELEAFLDGPRFDGVAALAEIVELDLGDWPGDPDWVLVRRRFREALWTALSPYLTHRLPKTDPPRSADGAENVPRAGPDGRHGSAGALDHASALFQSDMPQNSAVHDHPPGIPGFLVTPDHRVGVGNDRESAAPADTIRLPGSEAPAMRRALGDDEADPESRTDAEGGARGVTSADMTGRGDTVPVGEPEDDDGKDVALHEGIDAQSDAADAGAAEEERRASTSPAPPANARDQLHITDLNAPAVGNPAATPRQPASGAPSPEASTLPETPSGAALGGQRSAAGLEPVHAQPRTEAGPLDGRFDDRAVKAHLSVAAVLDALLGHLLQTQRNLLTPPELRDFTAALDSLGKAFRKTGTEEADIALDPQARLAAVLGDLLEAMADDARLLLDGIAGPGATPSAAKLSLASRLSKAVLSSAARAHRLMSALPVFIGTPTAGAEASARAAIRLAVRQEVRADLPQLAARESGTAQAAAEFAAAGTVAREVQQTAPESPKPFRADEASLMPVRPPERLAALPEADERGAVAFAAKGGRPAFLPPEAFAALEQVLLDLGHEPPAVNLFLRWLGAPQGEEDEMLAGAAKYPATPDGRAVRRSNLSARDEPPKPDEDERYPASQRIDGRAAADAVPVDEAEPAGRDLRSGPPPSSFAAPASEIERVKPGERAIVVNADRSVSTRPPVFTSRRDKAARPNLAAAVREIAPSLLDLLSSLPDAQRQHWRQLFDLIWDAMPAPAPGSSSLWDDGSAAADRAEAILDKAVPRKGKPAVHDAAPPSVNAAQDQNPVQPSQQVPTVIFRSAAGQTAPRDRASMQPHPASDGFGAVEAGLATSASPSDFTRGRKEPAETDAPQAPTSDRQGDLEPAPVSAEDDPLPTQSEPAADAPTELERTPSSVMDWKNGTGLAHPGSAGNLRGPEPLPTDVRDPEESAALPPDAGRQKGATGARGDIDHSSSFNNSEEPARRRLDEDTFTEDTDRADSVEGLRSRPNVRPETRSGLSAIPARKALARHADRESDPRYVAALAQLLALPAHPDERFETRLAGILARHFQDPAEKLNALRQVAARLAFADGTRSPALRRQALAVTEVLIEETVRGREPAVAAAAPPRRREEAGRFYLSQRAGLVIFAPYLALLFDRLGLLDVRRLPERALPGARRALQLLGDGNTPEAARTDPLEKLLLGQPQTWRHSNAPADPAPDPGLVDGLIRAVIARWSALGQTSPEGLQNAFVRRTGSLLEAEDGWRLTVDPGPFDMLLDRLPWSVGTVALPWMEMPLHVKWRGSDE